MGPNPGDRAYSPITVRRAAAADASAIAAVIASVDTTLRKIYRPSQKALDHKRRLSPTLTRLVALVNDRIVGTVQYCLSDNALRVIGLGVHEDTRRRGVARVLIQELTRIARASGASRLTLHTVKQTGNVPVFERLGFHVVAQSPDEFSESPRDESLTDVEMHYELK